jgi:DNA-directed RNA polymerase subunit M/transcription elongation factor TFIIS
MSPQRRFEVLTFLDWRGFGFTLVYPEFTSPEEALRRKVAAMPVERSKLHRCGSCGSNEVDYVQVQTRSADEPMTTFYNCSGCHRRWVG